MWELPCLFKKYSRPQIIILFGSLENHCAMKIANILYIYIYIAQGTGYLEEHKAGGLTISGIKTYSPALLVRHVLIT